MKGKEQTKMKTNTNEMKLKELEMDELEQVNGGSVIAGIALAAACVSLAVETAKFGRKLYNDLTK